MVAKGALARHGDESMFDFLRSLVLWMLYPGDPPPEPRRRLLTIAAARRSIQSGDLLLFRRPPFSWRRPSTWPGKLISVGGRSDYTHAARVAWWGEQLMVLEVRELAGGRIVSLESQVERYPGLIDHFEANWANCHPRYDRCGVVAYMRRLAGSRYGWSALARAALSHLIFVRLCVRVGSDDGRLAANRPQFCSQACANADRIGGGFDPVPMLADSLTEPGDLARSTFYRYRATLAPEDAS